MHGGCPGFNHHTAEHRPSIAVTQLETGDIETGVPSVLD
jgi:hypothetical protein